jgi:hypothetical protein
MHAMHKHPMLVSFLVFSICTNRRKAITKSTLGFATWWVFVVGVALSFVITALAIVKPVEFWSKCDRVFGMLFPCVLFQVLFLCPGASSLGASLPRPRHISWEAPVYGILVALAGTVSFLIFDLLC